MPNWKKLLSSGSSGSLSNLVVDNHISASVISGSFYGDGSGLTGVTADGTISSSAQVNITQTEGYSTFSSSIQTYTDAKVAGLVDSAPGTLDTLNELAAALGDDATFSASIATSIGNRVLTSTFNTYSGSAHTQREALKYTDDKVKAKLNSDGVVSGSYVESLPAGVVSGSSQIAFNTINNNPFINGTNHISASHHIVPLTNETYDLGSSTHRWRDLYLSGSTIDLGGTIITRDNNGDINFKDSDTLALKRVVVDELQLGSGTNARKLKIDNGKVKVTSKADADRVEDLALPTGVVSGSSQVTLTGTTGYTSFSSSVQTYTDAKITALSSSVDTHLDSNITSLSSSAHTDRGAKITALSGSAHTQRVAIASLIPTNTNQLTNGAGFITSIDGAISGSSQITLSDTIGYTDFSSSIQTYTNQKVAALVDSAPATLDTLNELAAALNDDANFSASIATTIGNVQASIPTNNNQLTNGAGYITGHPSISAASSVNNSGRTYIQDITLDSNGHVTGIASATETVTDTNYYLDGITKSGNTLTFSVNGTTNQTYEFGANAFNSTTIPTNNNQLTNGAGYTTYSANQAVDTTSSPTFSNLTVTNDLTVGDQIFHKDDTNTYLQFGADQLDVYTGGVLRLRNNNTGVTVNSDLSVVGDATFSSNGSSNSPTIRINNPGSSDFNHSIEAFTGNMTAGETNLIAVGKEGSTKNTGYIGYKYSAAGSNANILCLGHWGSDHLVNLTGDGKLGVGTQTPDSKLHVNGTTAGETVFTVTGTAGTLFSIDDSLTGELFSVADSSAVPIFSVNSNGIVSVSGDFRVSGDITAYYASDERLKKNIKPIDSPLEKLKLISGNTFEWDEENLAHNNKGKDVGVIAQEIEKVLPELVGERRGYKAVQYEKIVALLIESNKALLQRVEELESKLS